MRGTSEPRLRGRPALREAPPAAVVVLALLSLATVRAAQADGARIEPREPPAELAPPTLPRLVLALEARAVPTAEGGSRPLSRNEREAVLDALASSGRDAVRAHLAERVGGGWSPGLRRAALEVAGRVGDRRDLAACRDIAAGACEAVEDPLLADALEEATRGILRRHPETCGEVTALALRSPPALFIALARAVATSGHPDALAALLRLLGSGAELDRAVLAEIARAARCAPPPHPPEVLGAVRGYLSSSEPALVRAAALTAGHLGDSEAAGELVALLGDAEEGTREAAHWALRALSGLALPAERLRWSAWLEQELEWWSDRADIALEELHSRDTREVRAALLEIARHRLHRGRLGAAVAEALDDPDVEVRILACVALAEIGSRATLEALGKASEDPDPRVRSAALAGLR